MTVRREAAYGTVEPSSPEQSVTRSKPSPCQQRPVEWASGLQFLQDVLSNRKLYRRFVQVILLVMVFVLLLVWGADVAGALMAVRAK